jgi:hypothetical protein
MTQCVGRAGAVRQPGRRSASAGRAQCVSLVSAVRQPIIKWIYFFCFDNLKCAYILIYIMHKSIETPTKIIYIYYAPNEESCFPNEGF